MVAGSACVGGAAGSASALAADAAGCSCCWCCSCCFCCLMAFAGIGGASAAGVAGGTSAAGPLAVGGSLMVLVLLLVHAGTGNSAGAAGFKLFNRNPVTVALCLVLSRPIRSRDVG